MTSVRPMAGTQGLETNGPAFITASGSEASAMFLSDVHEVQLINLTSIKKYKKTKKQKKQTELIASIYTCITSNKQL